MSDPVILYGTQSNGETLPVQVDQYGRLVAEGLPGVKGEPGNQGPPGADGGSFPLPPDPYEGALLVWLNGGLAWVSSPPVPIPEGVFGPILDWTSDGTLTSQLSIPDYIGPGVYVSQCNHRGVAVNPDLSSNVSQDWSTLVTNSNFGSPDSPKFPFDGNRTSACLCYETFSLNNLNLKEVDILEITLASGASGERTQQVIVNDSETYSVTGSDIYIDQTPIIIKMSGGEVNKLTFPKGTNWAGLKSIKVDDLWLTDKRIGRVFGRVDQVLSNTQLQVSLQSAYGFTKGEYLTTENQRVAPWVLYGDDPSSFIDHLRRS